MREGSCSSSWASNCGYSHLDGILEGFCLVVGGLSNAAVHDKDDEVRLCLGGHLCTRKGAHKQTKLSWAQMLFIFKKALGLFYERRQEGSLVFRCSERKHCSHVDCVACCM